MASPPPQSLRGIGLMAISLMFVPMRLAMIPSISSF
jgi:hypothetical protein